VRKVDSRPYWVNKCLRHATKLVLRENEYQPMASTVFLRLFEAVRDGVLAVAMN
jgi:hypothetical protein